MADAVPAVAPAAERKGAAGCQDTSAERIMFLENELKKRTEEGQNLRSRAEIAEKELASVLAANSRKANKQQAAYVKKLEVENASLHAALKKLDEVLREKTNACVRQGKQIEALTTQVTSLREVVSITKDLLTIRNLEVQQLQKDVDSVQEKITLEREKHEKLTLAAKLNADLRKEYLNQVQLFHDLKGKYEQKVITLTNENERLAKLVHAQVSVELEQ